MTGPPGFSARDATSGFVRFQRGLVGLSNSETQVPSNQSLGIQGAAAWVGGCKASGWGWGFRGLGSLPCQGPPPLRS